MKIGHTFTIVLIVHLKSCFSINEENISKIICSITKFNYVNIFVGTLKKPIKLSKKLQRECSLLVKFIEEVEKFEDLEFISFAEYDEDNKEIL